MNIEELLEMSIEMKKACVQDIDALIAHKQAATTPPVVQQPAPAPKPVTVERRNGSPAGPTTLKAEPEKLDEDDILFAQPRRALKTYTKAETSKVVQEKFGNAWQNRYRTKLSCSKPTCVACLHILADSTDRVGALLSKSRTRTDSALFEEIDLRFTTNPRIRVQLIESVRFSGTMWRLVKNVDKIKTFPESVLAAFCVESGNPREACLWFKDLSKRARRELMLALLKMNVKPHAMTKKLLAVYRGRLAPPVEVEA